MKKLSILICFLAAFSLSYSQTRKPADQTFRTVKATTVKATTGDFTNLLNLPELTLDNANGGVDADSITLFTTNGIKFKAIKAGYNARISSEGDSVLVINGSSSNFIQKFSPKPGEASYNSEGFTGSSSGTLTARNPASTNLLQSTARLGIVSSATAGSIVYFTPVGAALWRGTQTGKGGFYVTMRFGVPQNVSNSFAFFGLSGATLSSSAAPSSRTSIIGVGRDAADGTLQFMYNDSSGTATKVNTGLTLFTTSVYELTLSADPFSSVVNILLKDYSQGTSATVVASANIPINSQFLKPIVYISNNTTAAAVAIDLLKIYAESKY